MLAKAEPRITKLSGYQAKYVERSGKALSKYFPKEFGSGICHRKDCYVCKYTKAGQSSRCKVKGVVYEAVCLKCCETHSEDSVNHRGRYVGETSRTLYERVDEHHKGLRRSDVSNFMFKH